MDVLEVQVAARQVHLILSSHVVTGSLYIRVFMLWVIWFCSPDHCSWNQASVTVLKAAICRSDTRKPEVSKLISFSFLFFSFHSFIPLFIYNALISFLKNFHWSTVDLQCCDSLRWLLVRTLSQKDALYWIMKNKTNQILLLELKKAKQNQTKQRWMWMVEKLSGEENQGGKVATRSQEAVGAVGKQKLWVREGSKERCGWSSRRRQK